MSLEACCTSCSRITKYKCIVCEKPFCVVCSVAEENENAPGWHEGVAVAYCNACYAGNDAMERYAVPVSLEESPSEGEQPVESLQKTKKRKPGVKAKWTSHMIDDMVDIIVNNDKYTTKLIFTNVKCQRNGELYDKIRDELKERVKDREPCPFTGKQIRSKFKKLIHECKKAALTIKTKSGIARFQEQQGYTRWFDQLFSLVKTRDSCDPEQAVDPSDQPGLSRNTEAPPAVSSPTASSSPPVNSSPTASSSPTANSAPVEGGQEGNAAARQDNRRCQFIPGSRASRKKKTMETQISEILEITKALVAQDPMDQLLAFAKEEAEELRKHQMQLMQMLVESQSNNQSNNSNSEIHALQPPIRHDLDSNPHQHQAQADYYLSQVTQYQRGRNPMYEAMRNRTLADY